MVNFINQFVSLLALTVLSTALPTEENMLQTRDVTCRDDLPSSSFSLQTSEAVECINYLSSLGSQACVATVSGQSFCRRGQTQITGLSRIPGKNAQSTW
ncbi:hypothetical protein BKA67DRAFT_565243 [Truncatella angustata]|uniref:Uncharacterized protein n=1 Tax=Truncatella angustata TaxID=152316 RepID=A0A9P8UL04_9PEZI|nr:uncharacterized protein BKA67DRAFT_565243 [Truncatella angustata]KAH6654475.1 hypothetical protein BKA67DRAFT_565243 [Truncatella angustata]